MPRPTRCRWSRRWRQRWQPLWAWQLGFALFFVFRPLLTHVPFTGTPFAPGDLSLHSMDVILVVIGVPIAAVVSARLALRRVQISPLGVRRRASSPPPRITRIIPLLAGIAVLAYFDAVGKPGSNGSQLLELLGAFVLLIVGLVIAGPWFTTAGSRVMADRARRPATLIAGRRLLDNPRAAFRFVSGLVVALFVTSAAIGALSSIAAASSFGGGSAGKDTLADLFCSYSMSNCPASARVPSVPGQVLAELRATPGVNGVTVVHQNPSQARQMNGFGVVACDQLAKTPAIGRCATGASGANVGYFLSNLLGHKSNASSTVWPSAHLSVAEIARLPVDAVVVATDGSSGSIERARTALERVFPFQGTAVAVESFDPSTARLLTMIQDMTNVVIVASLIIAACSLAVNIAAGLGERKRPFSLLRLTGVPTGVLRRVVALEGAMPLLVVAAVSIVVGLVSAGLYLHSQAGIAFRIPGIAYWATVHRRARGVPRDHRIDVPAPEPDHGTRSRAKRVTAPTSTSIGQPADGPPSGSSDGRQVSGSPAGGQYGSEGGVRQPRIEARSIRVWVARATIGRVSSARWRSVQAQRGTGDSDGPAGQRRRHRRRVALRRIEHRSSQAGHVVEKCGPGNAAVVDIGHRRLVRLGEGRCVAVPRPPGRFVNIDEHRDLGCRYALVTSRPMSAGHDGFKSLVPQDVGGQMKPLNVGLLDPGDGQVETAFGHARRLGM